MKEKIRIIQLSCLLIVVAAIAATYWPRWNVACMVVAAVSAITGVVLRFHLDSLPMIVKFKNPHPGLAGCSTSIPEAVRQYAVSLDGTTGDPQEVSDKILEIAGEGFEAKISDKGAIALYYGTWETGRMCWRVIQFDEVTE